MRAVRVSELYYYSTIILVEKHPLFLFLFDKWLQLGGCRASPGPCQPQRSQRAPRDTSLCYIHIHIQSLSLSLSLSPPPLLSLSHSFHLSLSLFPSLSLYLSLSLSLILSLS